MEILAFEIVDLGPAPEGYFDEWGPSFRQALDSSVIGNGPTAKEAFNDALNQLAFDGLGTKLLHESGIEFGFLSADAMTEAAQIEPHSGGEEDEEGDDGEEDVLDAPEEVTYHVGIRFQLPQDQHE